MRRITLISTVVALSLTAALAIGLTAARQPAGPSPLPDLPSGKVQLMSAGALAFGPNGVLFVGDSIGGSIVAIDTQDSKAVSSAPKVNVQGIDEKYMPVQKLLATRFLAFLSNQRLTLDILKSLPLEEQQRLRKEFLENN